MILRNLELEREFYYLSNKNIIEETTLLVFDQ
jgi:hypothetical protein